MRTGFRLVAFTAALLVAAPWNVAAQDRAALRVRHDGREMALSLATDRGFAAVAVPTLADVGWAAERTPEGALLSGPGGDRVEVRDGTPFVRWDEALLQLADAPYFDGGVLYVPLQFVTDFLPWKAPETYSYDALSVLLVWGGTEPREAAPADPTPPPATTAPAPDADVRRIIFIDAGHGGEDPGSISRSGIREKNVALGIALAMAKALEDNDQVEVVLIRDDDTYVPPWDRGAEATEMKGERPGIFVSIHANSFTNNARGFETYFLSEARTDHERRVAAIENAPLGVHAPEANGDDLDFILRELKNLDQQHWSSLLAEMVQGEVARIHPGPNRGVRQSPLAVLTNAIMPAVLVEIGYLSHPDEARLLARSSFQEEAGQAIARAVARFIQRYPPGSGSGGGAGR